jgi:epoxyqueuosine reductase
MVNNVTARIAHGQFIKNRANELGFSFCGFSKAEFLKDEAPALERWLKKGMQGEMSYMENYFDMRLDSTLLVPGAKSVVSLLYNYFPDKVSLNSEVKISKYAPGEDYHFVIKDKLKELLSSIQDEIGEVHGRVFVDSAPVLEKAWAKKSGLGWIGKNANLINKNQGSFFFLAELIIDLELNPDAPIKDYCGTCTACIDACPTDAIIEPYVVDGSKCISYFTIELKKEIPADYQSKLDDWIFGCDVCQDVCPWNRFSKAHNEPRFQPNEKLLAMNKAEWLEMTQDVFSVLAKRSPLKRAGLQKIQSSFFP